MRRCGGMGLLGLALLAIAGCGDDGGSPQSPTRTATPLAPTPTSTAVSASATPTASPTTNPTAIQTFVAELFPPLVAPTPIATPTFGQALGIVVAVTLGNPQQRYYYAFGQFPSYSSSSTPEGPLLDLPPDQIAFEIGSNTKVFNATVLARAVLDDPPTQVKVTLDTPIQDLLGAAGVELQPPPGPNPTPVTLRALATQSATFPFYACNDTQPYVQSELWCFLNNWTPPYAADTYWSYSDAGFITLSECTSYAFNQTYGTADQLLMDLVVTPLDMSHTAIVSGPSSAPANLAQGFNQDVMGAYSRDPLPDYPADNAGSGNLTSTPADMLTFLEAQMGGVDDPGLAQAIALTQEEAFPSMGLAWQLGGHFLIKNGKLGGWTSYMIVNPELRVGVMVFSNTGDSDQSDDPDNLNTTLDMAGRRLAEKITNVTIPTFGWPTPPTPPTCPSAFPICVEATPTPTPS